MVVGIFYQTLLSQRSGEKYTDITKSNQAVLSAILWIVTIVSLDSPTKEIDHIFLFCLISFRRDRHEILLTFRHKYKHNNRDFYWNHFFYLINIYVRLYSTGVTNAIVYVLIHL